MFRKYSGSDYKDLIPGIMIKTIVHGEKTLMTEVLLQKGSHLPSHEHVHEQTGYMVSGKMIFTIGDETHEVTAGDSWNVPSNVPHEAKVIEDSVAIEVFSPLREDYLELLK